MNDIGPGDEVICINVDPGSDGMPCPLTLYAAYTIDEVDIAWDDTPICTLVEPKSYYDCPEHGSGEFAFRLDRFIKRGKPVEVDRSELVEA